MLFFYAPLKSNIPRGYKSTVSFRCCNASGLPSIHPSIYPFIYHLSLHQPKDRQPFTIGQFRLINSPTKLDWVNQAAWWKPVHTQAETWKLRTEKPELRLEPLQPRIALLAVYLCSCHRIFPRFYNISKAFLIILLDNNHPLDQWFFLKIKTNFNKVNMSLNSLIFPNPCQAKKEKQP